MFYTYVNQLPMVVDNLRLSRGDRLEYACGTLRKSKADDRGFRAFVLIDRFRNVSYRIMRDGMFVEYPGGTSFIGNPEELKHTPFAVTGNEAEINSFLNLCERMVEEHKRKKSLRNRLMYLAKEPVTKIIVGVAIAYGIITALVLFFG